MSEKLDNNNYYRYMARSYICMEINGYTMHNNIKCHRKQSYEIWKKDKIITCSSQMIDKFKPIFAVVCRTRKIISYLVQMEKITISVVKKA